MGNANAHGFIYAISIEGVSGIKIGSTSFSPQKRLAQIERIYPTLGQVVASVPVQHDLRDTEITIHAILSKERIYGEWFALDVDQDQLERLVTQAQEWMRIAEAREEKYRPSQRKIPLPWVHPSGQHDSELATLRERLRELRRGKHLTQQDLQALSGVPYTTISRIETGMADEITTSTLRRLADALNVTTDYLLGVSDLPHGCLGEKP